MADDLTKLSTAEEIDILIKMGENHLLKANAFEKLQVEKCLTSLKTLKESLQEKEREKLCGTTLGLGTTPDSPLKKQS